MTKGIGTPENRETAFRVYALFGGKNIRQILGRLEWKHDLKISAQTLYEWKKEGRWDMRLTGTEKQDVLTFNERMLTRVLGLIEKYDQHFATGGTVKDAQSAYAYTNLIRTALELQRRMNRWESTAPHKIESTGCAATAPALVAPETDEEGHMITIQDGIFFRETEGVRRSD